MLVQRFERQRIHVLHVADHALDCVENGLPVQFAIGSDRTFLSEVVLQLSDRRLRADDDDCAADGKNEEYDTDDHTQNES